MMESMARKKQLLAAIDECPQLSDFDMRKALSRQREGSATREALSKQLNGRPAREAGLRS
jgi:hypothetical protein